MHPAVLDFVREAVRPPLPQDAVLEVGSLDVNGSIRHFFPHATIYRGLDIVSGPGVDIVADAAEWQPDQEYDVVVSTEVLEHADRWLSILETCYAALKVGGTLILTCATVGRGPHDAHGAPTIDTDVQYYANVPMQAFALWAEGKFAEYELRQTIGADLQFRGVKGSPGNHARVYPAVRWMP